MNRKIKILFVHTLKRLNAEEKRTSKIPLLKPYFDLEGLKEEEREYVVDKIEEFF